MKKTEGSFGNVSIPKDVIVEAGVDERPGRSLLDISPDAASRVKKGALYFGFGPDSPDPEKRVTLQEFATLEEFDNLVETLYIGNVITAKNSGIANKAAFEAILPNLEKKLTPTGTIIILENLMADHAEFLKSIAYEKYGLRARFTKPSEYQTRLEHLGLRETDAAQETLWRTGTPFILELTKK